MIIFYELYYVCYFRLPAIGMIGDPWRPTVDTAELGRGAALCQGFGQRSGRRRRKGGRKTKPLASARCCVSFVCSISGSYMGMDQYLLIPFLMGWTSIYQLFWCELQGYYWFWHTATCLLCQFFRESSDGEVCRRSDSVRCTVRTCVNKKKAIWCRGRRE